VDIFPVLRLSAHRERVRYIKGIFPLHSPGKIVKIVEELATGGFLFDVRRMAKEQKPAEPAPAPVPDTAEALGPPKSYRLQIMLGLVGLIMFQMIILWTLLPSREVVRANLGLDPLNGVTGIDGVSTVTENIMPKEAMVEIPVQNDPFKIKQPRGEDTENLTLRMYVVVRKKEERAFTRQYEQFTRRVLDRVESVLTLSTRVERQETGHTTIKERSKKAINEELGTPWVQQVVLSEYSFTVD
jgi:hypothetical protein